MIPRTLLAALLLAPLLGGCVVRTAANVATAPIRATSWTYDKLTTSQAEADRNRGRAIRKREERERREAKREEKERRKAERAD